MKELEKLTQDKKEVTTSIENKKEHKFLGSVRPHKGQKVFELNLDTAEIKEAVIETVEYKYSGGVNKEIIANANCTYTLALNMRNAIKKFKAASLRARQQLENEKTNHHSKRN